jgi:hypothetical protein
MLKKVISALLVSGIVAILTPQVTEANICPAGTFHYCTSSGGYSTCRCYSTSSVRCDLEASPVGPTTFTCNVGIDLSTPILVICANNAGKIAPGLQVVDAGEFVTLSASANTPGNRKQNYASAVVTVSLLNDPALKEQLDSACRAANNQHFSAVNAVPCVADMEAVTQTGGNIQSVTDGACELQVEQCFPGFGYPEFGFNKNNGRFDVAGYVCPSSQQGPGH